jgi:pimeloyl-ACP methyl ester carboxylesterase
MALFAAGCCADGHPEGIPIESISGSVETVILLHGLARTSASMARMEAALRQKGYRVVNVNYPSREHTIQRLNVFVIPNAVKTAGRANPKKIHFITHSMGGILVRYYLAKNKIEQLGRVVMLSPPNQGSEVIDKLRGFPGFETLNGPAGVQLGTDEKSIPAGLGPVRFETGIITGNKSINVLLSLLIPGNDDGKVSIENAKVKGMTDFLVLPHTHPFIMQCDDTIAQSIHFLQNGSFYHPNKTTAPRKK